MMKRKITNTLWRALRWGKASFLIGGLLFAQVGSAQQCLGGGCTYGANQYPFGDQTSTSNTFATVATDSYAGEHARYAVTNGETYEWSTRTNEGGNATYDSQLTLYTDDGATTLCYSDDVGGDDGYISWTANLTGFVRLQVNQYNCATNFILVGSIHESVSSLSLVGLDTLEAVGRQSIQPHLPSRQPMSEAFGELALQCSVDIGPTADLPFPALLVVDQGQI